MLQPKLVGYRLYINAHSNPCYLLLLYLVYFGEVCIFFDGLCNNGFQIILVWKSWIYLPICALISKGEFGEKNIEFLMRKHWIILRVSALISKGEYGEKTLNYFARFCAYKHQRQIWIKYWILFAHLLRWYLSKANLETKYGILFAQFLRLYQR